MALTTAVPPRVGESIQIRIVLPGTNQSATIGAEVCWSDGSGRVGVQFIQVSQDVTELLRSWLLCRLQESVPERAFASS